jgi:hypothetical protein
MVATCTKDFSWRKKMAQIRHILKTKIPRSPGYMIILEGSQEY